MSDAVKQPTSSASESDAVKILNIFRNDTYSMTELPFPPLTNLNSTPFDWLRLKILNQITHPHRCSLAKTMLASIYLDRNQNGLALRELKSSLSNPTETSLTLLFALLDIDETEELLPIFKKIALDGVGKMAKLIGHF